MPQDKLILFHNEDLESVHQVVSKYTEKQKNEILNSYPDTKTMVVSLLALIELAKANDELDMDDWEVDLGSVMFAEKPIEV